MTHSVSIMVLVLLVATASASINVLHEADDYISHNAFPEADDYISHNVSPEVDNYISPNVSPEDDNYIPHNVPSQVNDKYNSPLLRILLNHTSFDDPSELKSSRLKIVKRGTASTGVWKPFECPKLSCNKTSSSPPSSAGRQTEGQGTPLWAFILGILVVAFLPILKRTVVSLVYCYKYGRGRTLNADPIVRNSAVQITPDIADEEAIELDELAPLSPVPSLNIVNPSVPISMLGTSTSTIDRTPSSVDTRKSRQTPSSVL